jgi:hypothetical protein
MASDDDRIAKSSDIVFNPQRIGPRERVILVGLYLSKYDSLGLKKLGFTSFTEAFNVIGYALGAKPASVKNYRDEFDPLFPNRRKGWHKRQIRSYCLTIYDKYRHLDIDLFTSLVQSLVGYNDNSWSGFEAGGTKTESHFSNRLITGLAAERYFESVHPTLSQFNAYDLENTTQLGCGYDFRLALKTSDDFLAVEVKGLKERSGTLSLTPKEHETAAKFKDRFFLFVVKNFQESPFHEIFQNPLAAGIRFRRTERVTVQVSWLTSV